jgi:HPr kinase/phosphorylase
VENSTVFGEDSLTPSPPEETGQSGTSSQGITVEKLYSDRRAHFELSLLNGGGGLKRVITTNQINRPGLPLAGFFESFPRNRIQILGQTELVFLGQMHPDQRRERLEALFTRDLPCVFATRGAVPPPEVLEVADRYSTAVFSSRLPTGELSYRLGAYLDNIFAPWTIVHGTLVDVYGVGLLYTGKSGVGKSECALDLVERGHRLVADDMVKIVRRGPEVIVGIGSKLLKHHMEVRGIGIIDIEKLFGIRAIRLQKRIEVEVRLELWSDDAHYERLGIEDRRTTILGTQIPVITIPVSPGKNITVISEVIAMNHMLKVYGEESAKRFAERQHDEIRRQERTAEYLESDLE